MKLITLLIIIAIAIIITIFEWPKMQEDLKKEKRAYVALMTCGVILAGILIYFPDLPGPVNMLKALFGVS